MKRNSKILTISPLMAIMLIVFVLALPALSNFAHDHEYDGHDHDNCPAHLFEAAFLVDQAALPIDDCTITQLYILESEELLKLVHSEHYRAPGDRAPPA